MESSVRIAGQPGPPVHVLDFRDDLDGIEVYGAREAIPKMTRELTWEEGLIELGVLLAEVQDRQQRQEEAIKRKAEVDHLPPPPLSVACFKQLVADFIEAAKTIKASESVPFPVQYLHEQVELFKQNLSRFDQCREDFLQHFQSTLSKIVRATEYLKTNHGEEAADLPEGIDSDLVSKCSKFNEGAVEVIREEYRDFEELIRKHIAASTITETEIEKTKNIDACFDGRFVLFKPRDRKMDFTIYHGLKDRQGGIDLSHFLRYLFAFTDWPRETKSSHLYLTNQISEASLEALYKHFKVFFLKFEIMHETGMKGAISDIEILSLLLRYAGYCSMKGAEGTETYQKGEAFLTAFDQLVNYVSEQLATDVETCKKPLYEREERRRRLEEMPDLVAKAEEEILLKNSPLFIDERDKIIKGNQIAQTYTKAKEILLQLFSKVGTIPLVKLEGEIAELKRLLTELERENTEDKGQIHLLFKQIDEITASREKVASELKEVSWDKTIETINRYRETGPTEKWDELASKCQGLKCLEYSQVEEAIIEIQGIFNELISELDDLISKATRDDGIALEPIRTFVNQQKDQCLSLLQLLRKPVNEIFRQMEKSPLVHSIKAPDQEVADIDQIRSAELKRCLKELQTDSTVTAYCALKDELARLEEEFTVASDGELVEKEDALLKEISPEYAKEKAIFDQYNAIITSFTHLDEKDLPETIANQQRMLDQLQRHIDDVKKRIEQLEGIDATKVKKQLTEILSFLDRYKGASFEDEMQKILDEVEFGVNLLSLRPNDETTDYYKKLTGIHKRMCAVRSLVYSCNYSSKHTLFGQEEYRTDAKERVIDHVQLENDIEELLKSLEEFIPMCTEPSQNEGKTLAENIQRFYQKILNDIRSSYQNSAGDAIREVQRSIEPLLAFQEIIKEKKLALSESLAKIKKEQLGPFLAAHPSDSRVVRINNLRFINAQSAESTSSTYPLFEYRKDFVMKALAFMKALPQVGLKIRDRIDTIDGKPQEEYKHQVEEKSVRVEELRAAISELEEQKTADESALRDELMRTCDIQVAEHQRISALLKQFSNQCRLKEGCSFEDLNKEAKRLEGIFGELSLQESQWSAIDIKSIFENWDSYVDKLQSRFTEENDALVIEEGFPQWFKDQLHAISNQYTLLLQTLRSALTPKNKLLSVMGVAISFFSQKKELDITLLPFDTGEIYGDEHIKILNDIGIRLVAYLQKEKDQIVQDVLHSVSDVKDKVEDLFKHQLESIEDDLRAIEEDHPSAAKIKEVNRQIAEKEEQLHEIEGKLARVIIDEYEPDLEGDDSMEVIPQADLSASSVGSDERRSSAGSSQSSHGKDSLSYQPFSDLRTLPLVLLQTTATQ